MRLTSLKEIEKSSWPPSVKIQRALSMLLKISETTWISFYPR